MRRSGRPRNRGRLEREHYRAAYGDREDTQRVLKAVLAEATRRAGTETNLNETEEEQREATVPGQLCVALSNFLVALAKNRIDGPHAVAGTPLPLVTKCLLYWNRLCPNMIQQQSQRGIGATPYRVSVRPAPDSLEFPWWLSISRCTLIPEEDMLRPCLTPPKIRRCTTRSQKNRRRTAKFQKNRRCTTRFLAMSKFRATILSSDCRGSRCLRLSSPSLVGSSGSSRLWSPWRSVETTTQLRLVPPPRRQCQRRLSRRRRV